MTKYIIKKTIKGVRGFQVPDGLGTVDEIEAELSSMIDVLLDRVDSPVDNNKPLALMTVANAYLARAREIKFRILSLERRGVVKKTPRSVDVTKTDSYYALRVGELETFIELAKEAVDEGSRRLSAAQLLHEREIRGLS